MIIFPQMLRAVGEYSSDAYWLPPSNSSIKALLYGRSEWLRLGVDQTVVMLSIEVNTCGLWEFVASCTTVASEPETTGVDYTSIELQLSLPLIPLPQVRIILTCYSPCLCSGELEIV